MCQKRLIALEWRAFALPGFQPFETIPMRKIDTLIHARWVVPVDGPARVLENHAVAVHHGTIEAVLPCAEARAMFEDVLAHRTRLGLLSEDIDTSNGELWGNFPQTYSMVGIINGAVRLSAGWESVT